MYKNPFSVENIKISHALTMNQKELKPNNLKISDLYNGVEVISTYAGGSIDQEAVNFSITIQQSIYFIKIVYTWFNNGRLFQVFDSYNSLIFQKTQSYQFNLDLLQGYFNGYGMSYRSDLNVYTFYSYKGKNAIL